MVFAKGFKDGMFIGVTIINHGVEVIRVKFRNDMKIYIGNNVYIYNYEIKIRNSKCNAMI